MLTVAYIRRDKQVKQKKLTPLQELHNQAVASMAERREHERRVAQKMFGPERERLRELQQRLDDLCKAETN